MAEDINLPNLVSHLNVNLDGLSGAVGDAARQGSSMGAALGEGINRQLDDLLRNLPQVTIDGDSDPLDRDLARIHRDLAALDAQRIGVDISLPDALRQLEGLERNLQRIGDAHPNVNVRATTAAAARQLEELRAAARQVDDTDVDIDVDVDEEHVDRANRLTGAFGKLAGMAGSLGGVVGTLGKLGAGLGAAVPAAGAVVSTLANIAPAAGIAVTGLAAVQLASGTVKLAMVGVGDAISAALDPSKSEEFAESLEKLSPSAAKFATTVRDLSPSLRSMQQAVQEEAFRGLGENLERTAKSVLPVLRTNLLSTATALGDMAGGAMGAARDLADSGTLGKALGSASNGLRNLSGLPATVVTALGQIAAAAGPSFEGLTAAAAHSANLVGEKLSGAFKSGAMQDAIQTAVDLLGDLVDVGVNVGTILGNAFSAVPAGGGLVGTLGAVTTALAEITGTKEVQSGLRALFETMATVGATAAPLLGQALSVIAPVLTALGPPVQLLVTQLGAALRPVIAALGPVLVQTATALGSLTTAFAPMLPVLGQLVAALLPALSPLLAGVQQIFVALAPVVKTLAATLSAALAPILAQLPALIGPLVQIIATSFVSGLTLLQQLLVALGPSLVSMGATFGTLLAAVAPLIMAVAQLQAGLLSGLMPVIQPLIGLLGGLAAILAGTLARYINAIVVPAIQILTSLLKGDFSGAWNIAKAAASNAAAFIGQAATRIGSLVGAGVGTAVNWLKGLPGRAVSALSSLGSSLAGAAAAGGARLVSAISGKVSEALGRVRALPGQAASALGNLGGRLVGAGASLIQGFISGIQSKIAAVQSKLQSLTSKLTDWKGPKQKDAKILTPAGRLLIEGFIKGIDDTTAKLRSRLEAITKALPANVRSGIGKSLAKATAELQREVTKRDGVIKKLAAAQTKLDDLVKARSKAASDITSGILADANITEGRGDVNSVTAITVGLQQALKASKAFEANIAALKKSGLRSDLLQQIADKGVEGGSATAAALAKATPAELKRINDLQAQLAKSAAATGATVGDALYGAGIRAAQGLVAGLKSQEAAIEKQMRKIAENMLKTVKKAHKTKSPSRAFADIGRMDMEGLRGGVLATAHRVVGAVSGVAARALDAASGVGGALASVPSGPQVAGAYGGAGGSGGQNNVINLYGSDASPDGILRALSWRGLVGGGG
ncbi:hypothetical protein ACFWNK_01770 [Streptomyces sp. NPDC058417]|uniref:hypothetical protein n=1 Tax=unclassified Streptomyces TaxID=2593676 RepID=UPI00364601D0